MAIYDRKLSHLAKQPKSEALKELKGHEVRVRDLLAKFDCVINNASDCEETITTLGKDLKDCEAATDDLARTLRKNGDLKRVSAQVHKELDARFPSKRQKTSPWSTGEISTLIYGVHRLGEKEFADVLGQSMFLKNEHELKVLQDLATPERPKRSATEIGAKWA